MHVACSYPKVAIFLLDSVPELEVDAVNSAGFTPLMTVCKEASGAVSLVKRLISKNADFKMRNAEKDWSALHFALSSGNVLAAKVLISRYLKSYQEGFKLKDKEDNTILHIMLRQDGMEDLLDLVLDGCDYTDYMLDEVNNLKHTPLLQALTQEWEVYPNKLLDLSHLDAMDKAKDSVIHLALKNQAHIGVARKLVREFVADEDEGRGDDSFSDERRKEIREVIQRCNTEDDKTVLHLACERGAGDIAMWLIDSGEVDSVLCALDKEQKNVLYYACQSRLKDVVTQLLELPPEVFPHSAVIQKTSAAGDTPLHVAVRQNDEAIVEALAIYLSEHEDQSGLSIRNAEGYSPLDLAFFERRHIIAKILIKHGAPVIEKCTVSTLQGYNALHLAVAFCPKVVEEVLELMPVAERDATTTEHKQTALHLALTCYAPAATLAKLLKFNLAVNVKDGFEKTPLIYAIERGDSVAIDGLLEHGARAGVLVKAERAFDASGKGIYINVLQLCNVYSLGPDVMWKLLKKGVGKSLGQVDVRGHTILHTLVKAARQRAREASGHNFLRNLIGQMGQFLNDRIPSSGRTALHFAAMNNCKDLVETLLGTKADAFVTDNKGQTPLHLVVANESAGEEEKSDQVDIVRMLLRRPCGINAQDYKMQTPLHIAAQRSNKEIVNDLLNYGALLHVQDMYGVTPAQLLAPNELEWAQTRLQGQLPRAPYRVRLQRLYHMRANEEVLQSDDFFQRRKIVAGGTALQGSPHSAIIMDSGELFTFGRCTSGQLGLGKMSTLSVESPTMVSALRSKMCRRVSCGETHTAVVTESGALYTFGSNTNGELGHGPPGALDRIEEPTLVKALLGERIVDVSCGGNFTAAITDAGDLYTFGAHAYGNLGRASDDHYWPRRVQGLSREDLVVKVVCLRECMFVLAKSSHEEMITNMYVTGVNNNSIGLFGMGDVSHRFEKLTRITTDDLKFQAGEFIQTFDASINHIILLTSMGRVLTSGKNNYGQLGTGDKNPRYRFTLIKPLTKNEGETVSFRTVHAASYHSGAVTRQGILYTWGDWDHGKTGHKESWKNRSCVLQPALVEATRTFYILDVGGCNSTIVGGRSLLRAFRSCWAWSIRC